MDFSDALRAVKAGKRARRAGWNGKGMWIALTPGSAIRAMEARAGAAHHLVQEATTGMVGTMRDLHPVIILPHIDMRAADGSLVIGWLASQTDILAEDWEVLPEHGL